MRRMVLWQFLAAAAGGGLWYRLALFNGYVLYQLCRALSPPCGIDGALAGCSAASLYPGESSGMVIWVGDPNLLYTLPVVSGGVLPVLPGVTG